jgi:hypothetical protein
MVALSPSMEAEQFGKANWKAAEFQLILLSPSC